MGVVGNPNFGQPTGPDTGTLPPPPPPTGAGGGTANLPPPVNQNPSATDSDLTNASNIIQQYWGRPPTANELAWIQDGNVTKTWGGVVGAANEYLKEMNQWVGTIQSDANAFGLNGLSTDAAKQMLSGLYVVGDASNLNNMPNLINSSLSNLKIQQMQNPTKNVNDLINPPPINTADNTATITDIFQKTLGRDPNKYELDEFNKELASGQETAYGLTGYLQQTTEYQTNQNNAQQAKYTQEATDAQNSLASSLLDYQQQAFDRATPDIIGQYMRAGRLNSSGLDSALANAQGQLESQRQQFLGNVGYQNAVQGMGYNRQDFLNTQGNAFDQYLRQNAPAYSQQMGLANMAVQSPFANQANITQNANNFGNYNMQKNDFNDYLSSQQRAANQAGLWGLAGNVLSGAAQGAAYKFA